MAFRALTSFSLPTVKGGSNYNRIIGQGDVLSDDDPVVKKYPHLVEPLEDHLRTVEAAAASPGVKRDLGVVIPPSAKPKKAKKLV